MKLLHELRASRGIQLSALLIGAVLIRMFGYGLYCVPTGSMETTMLVGEFFFADKWSLLFSDPNPGDIIVFDDPAYVYAGDRWRSLFERYAWGPSNWTKRVIGVPGDRIKGVIEDGVPVLYRNEIKREESYRNSYPLVAVWSDTPKTVEEGAGSYAVTSLVTFKSYDPSRQFDCQPWYCIDAAALVRDSYGVPLMRQSATPLAGQAIDNVPVSAWNGSDEFCVTLGADEYWVMGDNRMNSYDSRSFGPLKREHIHGTIRWRIASFDTNASWLLVQAFVHPIDFFKHSRWNRWFQTIT